MKLHQLRALVAIADTGSVRNAARAIELSPAAITKAMRELEDEVGLTLIVRETTGVTLTEAGQKLLEHARLVTGQLLRATQELAVLAGKKQGTLSVGVPSWFGLTLLGDVVNRFEREMPQIQLVFFESLLSVSVPKLRDGTLDLSINRAHTGPTQAEFDHLPLFMTGYAVVARAGHPLANCRSLEELKDARWILNRNFSTDEIAVQGDKSFAEYFRRYTPLVHVSHSSTLATSLIATTDLLSIMPWPLAELLVAREGLCVLSLAEVAADVEISLMYRRAAPLSASAKCFVECLTEVIREAATSTDAGRRRLFHSVECLLK
ncbi:DNA-binding transcriptional LysR family regulator [Paraburkholderia sp. BL27I4N3]|uniref:LysR family transcriptional regulator n=1 Tax=Paraburkholderia sp. BL27I4N3 TaxID=1938805 RepID=UPI000E245F46|nr:LysR substrate-binding domain-containing protein [Paraburkholderia sp. BL27I4N3]REE07367.1 DNA-binding transcriptional LysR family regulator [Paraburkholderia sp. BL27I4N3]